MMEIFSMFLLIFLNNFIYRYKILNNHLSTIDLPKISSLFSNLANAKIT